MNEPDTKSACIHFRRDHEGRATVFLRGDVADQWRAHLNKIGIQHSRIQTGVEPPKEFPHLTNSMIAMMTEEQQHEALNSFAIIRPEPRNN